MDSQNVQTITIIEDIYNIYEKFSTFPTQIDEAIVLFGLYDSRMHQVASDYFNDYAIPAPTKKGFRGTYYYLVLVNSKPNDNTPKKAAFAFRTEFYINQMDLFLLVEKADRLKVILLTPSKAFANTDGRTSFEYLHKEMLSFLSFVTHNNRSVGLVVMDGDVPVQLLLAGQSYQSPLMDVFSANYVALTQSSIAKRKRQFHEFLIRQVNEFATAARASDNIRFYHHKHYARMNEFNVNYNERLTGLSRHVADQLIVGFAPNASLAELNQIFLRFMDVVLSIEFHESLKRPLNLVNTLAIKDVLVTGSQQDFANNLDSHLDLLSGAAKKTGAADASYRIKDMEFFEKKLLTSYFADPQQHETFLNIIKDVKYHIDLSLRLHKLEKPLNDRVDRPSIKIYRNIGPALKLTVSRINEKMDGIKEVRHIFSATEFQLVVNLSVDLYKAEMAFVFIQKFIVDEKLLEPFDVLRKDFDEILEEISERLTSVANLAMGGEVRTLLSVVVPRLRARFQPLVRTQNSATRSIRQMKEILKKLEPMTNGDFRVNEFFEFIEMTNVTVRGTSQLTNLESLLTTKAQLVETYRTKYYGDKRRVGDGREDLKLIINAVVQEFKAKAIAEVMKLLLEQQAPAVNTAIEKYDTYLNEQLRLRYDQYVMTDPDDWAMWRQQTKQPFQNLHHMQDTAQRIGHFVMLLQLFCDNHFIPRPEEVLAEFAAIQNVFDEIERELVDEIQTPIDTTYFWGRRIKVSHSYLLNSAGTSMSLINSAVKCVTCSQRCPTFSGFNLFATFFFVGVMVKRLFK